MKEQFKKKFFAAGVNLKTLMQAVMFTVTFTNNKGDNNDDNKDGKIAILSNLSA